MAWVVALKAYCPILGAEAYLLEDREYQQGEAIYSVVARRCSYDVFCNLDDHIRCAWCFKPGGVGDPFGVLGDSEAM
jgi:hypothetical protein